MDQILQLNEFFVEGGDQQKSHVLLHITEPSTPEERAKGYFFAICEVNNGESGYITELQSLIDQIENEYYAEEEDADKNALELVLEKVNQENVGLLQKKPILHCIVGAVRNPDIIFSAYGNPDLMLFYKNRQGLYQRMNLLEAESETVERPQLFSQIIQGKISQGDFLFAGTNHIRDYFDTDRLQKIITTRPAKSSAEHLERVLGELQDGFSFGGLIIQVSAKNAMSPRKARPVPHEDSAASLTGLFATHQNTASTLAPSIFNKLKQKIKRAVETGLDGKPAASPFPKQHANDAIEAEINASHIRSLRAEPPPGRVQSSGRRLGGAHEPSPRQRSKPKININWQSVQSYLALTLKILGRGLAWFLILVYSALQGLIRSVVLLFFVATNYQNRRRNIIDEWRRKWRALQSGFARLPRVTQIIVVGLAIVMLAFIVSLLYLRRAGAKRVAESQFQTAIASIKSKKDSAESALIYKDMVTALAEIHEAEALLSTLPCASKETSGTCQGLERDLGALLTKIRRLSTVPAETLATWTTNAPSGQSPLDGVRAAPDRAIKINGTIIGFSSSTSKLALFNLLTKETKVIDTNQNIAGFKEGSVPKENDYALLMFNHPDRTSGLLSLNPSDNSVKILEFSFPADNVNIQSATVYNRRLYSLDIANNQIYKHDSIKTGFGPGKPWVKDTSVDLKNGGDLTIDGDLFVIKTDGQITKLTAGDKQPFTIQGLDPLLAPGASIWTYNDLNFIYILDPANKRIVILNKDGMLDRQLTANEFVHPTDFIIDEPNNTAYIIDGGKLYKINLR